MHEKTTWDIVIVGGANWDYLVRGEKLPKSGETVMGKTFQEAPGGKGANQAIAARRLGARVALVARLGADERGKAIVKRLNEEGVETKFIRSDEEGSTGIALVMVDEHGEKQILTAPGVNRQFGVDEIHNATAALQSTRALLMRSEET